MTASPEPTASNFDSEIWSEARLTELRAEVGDAGLRDILHLFQGEFRFLQDQLATAAAAGNGEAAAHVLTMIADAAAGLGLAALAGLARRLRASPLDAANPLLLTREAGRVRCVPPLRHAS